MFVNARFKLQHLIPLQSGQNPTRSVFPCNNETLYYVI